MRARPWLSAAAAITGICLVIALWIRTGPLPDRLLDEPMNPSTLVVDRNGVRLRESLSSDDTRALRLSAASLPPSLVAATLAAEDRRYWHHIGVDPVAMVRALRVNLAEGRIVEGGSTISQQVAKLLLNRRSPSRRRDLLAKVYEAVIALRLEHRFGKTELLAMYLNLAAYGNQYVGAERASLGYFGVRAAMATPAQAAFLAGLPQRPSAYNPYRNRDSAIRRQRTVLRRMQSAGALTETQAREALDERLAVSPRQTPSTAPHFVEMVLASIGEPRPARIETTLDATLQADVTGIIQSHRELLRQHGAQNVAVVVLDNERGEWLAWEGSGDFFDTAHGGSINGPTTLRQPGSALKPLTYALAFEQGASPATVLADVPSSFPTAEPGVVYSPRNYDGLYRGPLLARRALAGSENVPAVALAAEVGVPALLRFMERAGLRTFDRTASYYGLGLTLGNAEVRLDQLAAAYAVFARGGEWIEPTYLHGGTRAPSVRRLVSPRTAFWITDILSDAEAREFVFGRGGSLDLPFPVAVKTGTSQAYHDNWTIGYSRRVTVGVWVGNFDRTPLRNSSGVTGAAPIFHAVMLAAERRVTGSATTFSSEPILPVPSDLVERDVCAVSGLTANAWCPLKRHEFVAADAPNVACDWHHLSDEGVLTFWPPEYQHWAHDQGLDDASRRRLATPTIRRVAARNEAAAARTRTAPLTIVSPPAGATYLVDPTLRREFQTLPLRAVTTAGGPIDWTVSGQSVGSAAADRAIDWPLARGEHHIVARDQYGHRAEATIVVR